MLLSIIIKAKRNDKQFKYHIKNGHLRRITELISHYSHGVIWKGYFGSDVKNLNGQV